MTIDLTNVDTKAGFHMTMKSQLGFPDWYGDNWDAFWDAITRLVEMPDCLVLQNWETFAQACSKDMQILRQIVADYQREALGRQILLGE
ncbi:barstar family protein [Hymenobacter sp. PAMC 26628]|uniref:barstar family protein n=1 Tax=Hymenobacter sp. PAMC 26628 TaxID=1484118 RepID=UPI0007702067|nr:barstar family protein [Hymenobacter sp. PAMC 26628]AMJ64242.1 hypothetical protein AXW84_01425 [Hymenobacter sp. PAMC 26628]